MFTPEELEKLTKLRDLARIPGNDGEQFISVYLNLVWSGFCGHIDFGFNWKCNMGTQDFHSLDEAIKIVEGSDCGSVSVDSNSTSHPAGFRLALKRSKKM